MSEAVGDRIASKDAAERLVNAISIAVFFLGILIAALCVFLVTLGFDEAWTLQGISGLVEEDSSNDATSPVMTSGGLYALTNVLVQFAAGNIVWAHRALSLACLIAICCLIARICKDAFGKSSAASIPLLMLIGTPNTLFLSGSAYANTHAFLVFLLAVMLPRSKLPRYASIILGGALCGLAASTRTEYAFGIPCLALWYLLGSDRPIARIRDCVISAASSAISFGAFVALLLFVSSSGLDIAGLSFSTGVSKSFLDYPAILNKWAQANDAFILPMAALATIFALVARKDARSPYIPLYPIFVATGWLIYLAWLLRSPFSHNRYLWPSLAMFSVVIGFGLVDLRQRLRSEGKKSLALIPAAIALSFAIAGTGNAVRYLAMGESDIITTETSGYSGLNYFRAFQHKKDQDLAAYYIIDNYAEDESFGVMGADRELEYLTGRPLTMMIELEADSRGARDLPSRFVVPRDTYYSLTTECRVWIDMNCALEAQFGGYSFYEVRGDYPKKPLRFITGGYGKIANPLSAATAGLQAE